VNLDDQPASDAWMDGTSAPDEGTTPAPEAPPTVPCWRCELAAPIDAPRCPHCGASQGRERSAPVLRASDDVGAVKVLLVWYGMLLLTGVIHGFTLQLRFAEEPIIAGEVETQILYQVLAVEVVDTILIACAFLSIRLPPGRLSATPRSLGSWFAAAPVLLGLLAINIGYHWVVRETLRLPLLESEFQEQRGWLTFVAVCIQPAIVEEAFCRGLALGVLRRVVGRNSAVFLTAGMFALMHVAVLLSMPYLFLLGLALGYLRIASGSIALPIVVHFLHNLAVLLYEWR
jgi:membrane protease YdiL (CAAX protease family)